MAENAPFTDRALMISQAYCGFRMGAPKTLNAKFPEFTLEDYRDGLLAARLRYAEERTAWETKYDLVFPEFRFDGRIHPLNQRKQVEAVRLATLGLKEELLSTDNPLNSVLVELACIHFWLSSEREFSPGCSNSAILLGDLSLADPDLALSALRPGQLGSAARGFAEAGQNLYMAKASSLLKNLKFGEALSSLASTTEGCLLLAFQCHDVQVRKAQ